MDPTLKSQLRQVVSVAITTASVDIYGQAQTATPATCFARVEPTFREIPAAGGILRTSHMLILAEDAPVIDLNAKVWLPGDSVSDTTQARRPKLVHACYDERGRLDHWEVLL